MGPLYEMWKEWAVDGWGWTNTGGRMWRIIATGLMIIPVLYVTAFVIELANCLLCGIPTGILGLEGVFTQNTINNQLNCMAPNGIWAFIPIWSGGMFWNSFLFLSVAGIVIGVIYGITAVAQNAKRTREIKLKEEIRKKQEELAELGDAQAAFELGLYYNSVGSLETALEWLEKAAAQGHQDAIYMKSKIRAKVTEADEKRKNAEMERKWIEDLKELEREALRPSERMIFGDDKYVDGVEGFLKMGLKMSPKKLAEAKKEVSDMIDDMIETKTVMLRQFRNDLPGNHYLMSLIERHEKCIKHASDVLRKF